MQFLKRFLPSFLVSWLLTFTLASLFHSQYVVNQLVDVGTVVTFDNRLSLMLGDWLGLLPTYGIIIAVAFLLAFFIAAAIYRKLGKHYIPLFVLAGIASFTMMLTVIESIMNIHIIAGARGWGFYAQLLAGAVGGFAFANFTKVKIIYK
ncbi:hypothetical protein HII17_11500 [Thalassotalea sp. M1531]|uniref:Uncharacterized protein n=1 Tax=Thalassotalea algicola TaxID=2716224 RepID=A0A7Y0Q7H0_9GAMM|nr:hypothetical protein [Thalassotalea algicola]NMP32196.1 hypothetical protein [Thalassotalea algicola]